MSEARGGVDAVFALVLRSARILSPGAAWWLGGVLGHAFGRLPMRDQRRCRTHLAIAFPERDARWIERTARRTFRHFGRMALWTLATLHRDPRTLARGMAVEGRDNIGAMVRAHRRKEATVGLSGHFGNWELLARVASTLMPLTVLGRRLRHPAADRIIAAMRTPGSTQLIYQDQGLRPCLRALRDGRLLATLPDQDVPRLAGCFVPWFGHPAHTPTGPATLALIADCCVQPAFLYARAGRWVMHWGPRRRFTPSGDREADARAITVWAMAYLETMVRRAPEQWAWWHKRWRTQPDGADGR